MESPAAKNRPSHNHRGNSLLSLHRYYYPKLPSRGSQDMILVTGAAGFIGSNLVAGLNQLGQCNILAVDDLQDGTKALNLADLQIADYMDYEDFYERMQSGHAPEGIRAVFHQGACSDTTEWNGRYVMRVNYSYSKVLLHYCIDRHVPFIYASSASVYGAGSVFTEEPRHERPLTLYAFSKCLFDNYVRRHLAHALSQVAGLRYFNVYGPREQHKGHMASVVFHFDRQVRDTGEVRLFVGSGGYADGEQSRDFVYVSDCVATNLWLWQHPEISGIYNCGTGKSRTFNEVARAVIGWHGQGMIRYIPFPPELQRHYQSFTEADMTALRNKGFDHQFLNVQQGVHRYLEHVAGTRP